MVDSTYFDNAFVDILPEGALREFIHGIRLKSERLFSAENHGDFPRWAAALEKLSEIVPEKVTSYDLQSPAVRIGQAGQLSSEKRQAFRNTLMQFHPWRKGPYNLFGVEIDCEWRSDMKWERIRGALSPLQDRTVLDIGCGNGYHCWRMLGQGAKAVLGIDPMLQYAMQFQIFHRFLPLPNIELAPVGLEALPARMPVFDTVFSMGVLYHRRSPLDHLNHLRSLLGPGGELVLETLVVDGPEGYALLPQKRYARMRNVWFLPSALTLEGWLKRCGFKNIHMADITATTTLEQRQTPWMTYDSLEKCLDPNDKSLTIEGLPAPVRAVFVCE